MLAAIGMATKRATTKRSKTKKPARKYGKAASKKVEKAMSERKKGTLRSGRSKKKVTSKKQAVAIGLSQARKRGAKVPKRTAKRSSAKRTKRSS